MVGATTRGLGIEVFDALNPGQIMDYCIEYNAQLDTGKGKPDDFTRDANQLDFDRF